MAPWIWQASGDGVPNNAIVTAVTSSTVTINLPATSTGSGNYTFGQSDYPLPSDFHRPIDNTFWDRSRYWAMRGPQSPQQWQLYKSSLIGRASIQRRYRFRAIRNAAGMPLGQYLSIDPLPLDNGSSLVFEYVSNGWCESYLGVPQNSWQADTDVGVLYEYLLRLALKYRLLRRLGLSYSEELDEYERQVDKAMAVDGGAPILNMTPIRYYGLGNVPESGFGPASVAISAGDLAGISADAQTTYYPENLPPRGRLRNPWGPWRCAVHQMDAANKSQERIPSTRRLIRHSRPRPTRQIRSLPAPRQLAARPAWGR